MVVKRGVRELKNGIRDIRAGSLNWNIVVLLEVDAGVLLRRVVRGAEKIPLQTRVRRARDVLAVAPLAVTSATGVVTAAAAATSSGRRSITAAGGRVAVSIGVEATTAGASTPIVGLGRSCARRREITRSAPARRGGSTSVKGVVTAKELATTCGEMSRSGERSVRTQPRRYC
jgi:hypothetical protein